nr:integrase, catalytic region, zinc finger, CCHC-type, peptidase aspartic, catalytic [Tanacetum cinerariifolium]
MQISQLKETHSEADRTLDFMTLDFQITQLTEKVIVLQELNEIFRVENAKIKQHYKELNNREVHLGYLKHLKERVATLREIIEEARAVIQIVLWYLDLGCSKCMTGDHLRLRIFIKKFIRTIRFENDHFGSIMGYEDYVISDSVISRVYYVEGLRHNHFFVRQLCDSDLEVAFRKHLCYVLDTDGVELIKGSRGSNLYAILVEDLLKSSLIFLLSKSSKNKSWLWHCRLYHLNFGTINDLARKDLVRGSPRLKFEKDHLCSACQLGKSKKHTDSGDDGSGVSGDGGSGVSGDDGSGVSGDGGSVVSGEGVRWSRWWGQKRGVMAGGVACGGVTVAGCMVADVVVVTTGMVTATAVAG